MEQCEGVIAFHHVNFRYPGATEDVLSDIDFVAEPGKTTAIIGSTGCGKSTLVNLLPRFYDVTGGEITLDGTDIRKYTLQDLREHIGFVPTEGSSFLWYNCKAICASGQRMRQMSRSGKQRRLRRQQSLLTANRMGMRVRLHRAEAMFPADRSSGLPLPEQLQKIQRFMCLMTVFPLWI